MSSLPQSLMHKPQSVDWVRDISRERIREWFISPGEGWVKGEEEVQWEGWEETSVE